MTTESSLFRAYAQWIIRYRWAVLIMVLALTAFWITRMGSLVALSIMGGYSVLQVSGFAFYNQVSNMVLATMGISACFALFFLRALMMLFKPRFIFGDRREALFQQAAISTRSAR